MTDKPTEAIVIIDLKPCPFCGGPPEMADPHGAFSRLAAVCCVSCEIKGPLAAMPEQAAAAWNLRSSAPQEPDDAVDDILRDWEDGKMDAAGTIEDLVAHIGHLKAQEPVADDDAEWLRAHFIGPDFTQSTCPPIWMQSWQDRLERIAARLEDKEPDDELIGTTDCPYCGSDTPHSHTPDEIAKITPGLAPRLTKLADEMRVGFYSAMHRAYGTDYSHGAEKALERDLRQIIAKLVSPEPTADDDALIERLRSLMKRAEPLPWVWEQCGEKEDCPVIGVASDADDKVLSGELPDHGDEITRFNIASDWGSGVNASAPSANAQFVVEVVNALPKLLTRLQTKAPETAR